MALVAVANAMGNATTTSILSVAPTWPMWGGYVESCEAEHYVLPPAILTAKCKDKPGDYRWAQIDLNACLTNDNGNLRSIFGYLYGR